MICHGRAQHLDRPGFAGLVEFEKRNTSPLSLAGLGSGYDIANPGKTTPTLLKTLKPFHLLLRRLANLWRSKRKTQTDVHKVENISICCFLETKQIACTLESHAFTQTNPSSLFASYQMRSQRRFRGYFAASQSQAMVEYKAVQLRMWMASGHFE